MRLPFEDCSLRYFSLSEYVIVLQSLKYLSLSVELSLGLLQLSLAIRIPDSAAILQM